MRELKEKQHPRQHESAGGAEVDVLIIRAGWIRLPAGLSESFRSSVAFCKTAAILVMRLGIVRLFYLPAGRIAILLRFSEKSREA